MAQNGFKRPGGRKSKAEETRTRELTLSVLTKKYGTLEAAMLSLLDSGEPSLIRFVYEHGFGKPQDKVDVTSGTQPVIGMVIEQHRKK